MGKTKIEWTDMSWSVVTGCSPVSTGCRNCYAARMAATRLKYHPRYKGLAVMQAPGIFRWTGEVRLNCDVLKQPLHWRKPRMVFVASMSDLFHEDVPFTMINSVLNRAYRCPQHIFQVLTKRPERMLEWFCWFYGGDIDSAPPFGDNLWLGVSVENQAAADERREYLRQIPAAVKFISYEPALGPVDWAGWEFVDQIISGGESGPRARSSHPDWHRATRDFCQENGIAYFFKGWGAWLPIGDFDSRTGVYHYSWKHAELYKRVVSIGLDGKVYNNDFPPRQGWHMARVGKKRAGRLLDGVLWEEYPNE